MNAPLYHPLILPGLTIPGNVLLAPLAGYTDRAFRELCAQGGAVLGYTEMVSCEGILRGNGKTTALMERAPGEGLLGIQVFSGDPEAAGAAGAVLPSFGPDLADLNCGCPVPKVCRSGGGAALLKTPDKIGLLVEALRGGLRAARKAAGLSGETPVTVKIRSGWDAESLTYLEAAGAAVEAGAAMVGFHPRTRSQGYGGRADWGLIGRLKKAVSVPVIASGDLYTPEDVREVMTTTGCDGVMIARGALGRPFLFARIRRALDPGFLPAGGEGDLEGEIPALEAARRHLDLARRYGGDPAAFREMKKHLCYYVKNLPGSRRLRSLLMEARRYEDYYALLAQFGVTAD
ncbi:MAG: tRNA dihydrouridine synthase DusB [Spirochaetales bacterium]|jgi:nifR3 family TIM-barrel protein|nr:tRNA dihydrouridine synthase DusB [Spirochaetales bacterium]